MEKGCFGIGLEEEVEIERKSRKKNGEMKEIRVGFGGNDLRGRI